jgi:hypothetical protein
MRSKLLIMSTAALLAGTLAAASQSIQPGSAGQEKEKGSSSQGVNPNGGTRGQATKGAQAQPGREENRQGQVQRDQDKLKGQTQGQAERDQDKAKSQGQVQRDQDKTKSQTQGQNQRDQDRTQGQNQGRVQPGERERSNQTTVSFTSEQRTKIRETVLKERNAPRISKVDFAINVGTVVPRTVHIIEVPEVIVEFHPEWRGYRYFIVNDEIVIVEPDTLKIVAVVAV